MVSDLGVAYRSSRERITSAIRSAIAADPTVDQLPVPATPGWSVHDLVAHVTGVVQDALSGNMKGAPLEPWTAAQVERGRSRSIDQLLDGWAECAPQFEAFLSSPAGEGAAQALFDVHTHEADLFHALGRRTEVPLTMWSWMSERFIDGFEEEVAGTGLDQVVVSAPAFEIVRGRLGRRTDEEVRSFDWSTDPEPYLDLFFIFGRRDVPLGELPPLE